jgi:soluble lytic murein transglycosylase
LLAPTLAEVAAAQAPPPIRLPPALAATKLAKELVHQHKLGDATALAASIDDPLAQKLVEWVLLRSSDETGLERNAHFIRDNPDWPSIPLLRRRAEERLWKTRADAPTVRGFLDGEPASAAGRVALARMLMGEGDRAGAEREVRAVWRSARLSAELEAAVLDSFRDVLTRADHMARMDWLIGAKDFGAAMRLRNGSAMVKSRSLRVVLPPRRRPVKARTRPRTRARSTRCVDARPTRRPLCLSWHLL